jgi:hypothetical protein
MMSTHERDEITSVGPGTPAGTMMREYWIPAGDFISSKSVGWLEAYGNEVRASANPTGVLRSAG